METGNAPEPPAASSSRKERNFPLLELGEPTSLMQNPLLVVQSPKTPTLSRKLKAVSLDSDPPAKQPDRLDVDRDVLSMPNTPKRQAKKLSCDFDDVGGGQKLTPTSFVTNLSRFGSNTSISGSQTLKTLPEVMTLQDFSDNRTEQSVKVHAKGLLERRGSNASLTIDLGSNSNLCDVKKVPKVKLNPARSVNNLYLTSFGNDKCDCTRNDRRPSDRRKSQTEKCVNCTIYEAEPSRGDACAAHCRFERRCPCGLRSRRKSLSNENLYVPPCNACQDKKDCRSKGHRKACYPRQADLETSQLLSDDFKSYLQNIQYLQTAGNVLSIDDLKLSCDKTRVPKLHQEFWEVPLNLQEKCLVSGSQNKNRYRGVLPNEHSRVLLPGSNYIHANYIKGPDYTENAYIATQGPMAHTCEDFWEMVWMSKCNCIVMLTNLVEKGRSKCELYFPLGKRSPDSKFRITTAKTHDRFTFTSHVDEETFEFEERDEVRHGRYRVRHVSSRTVDECSAREFELTRCDTADRRRLRHFWFPNWRDHKMASPEQVLGVAVRVLAIVDGDPADDTLKYVDLETINETVPSGEGVHGDAGETDRHVTVKKHTSEVNQRVEDCKEYVKQIRKCVKASNEPATTGESLFRISEIKEEINKHVGDSRDSFEEVKSCVKVNECVKFKKEIRECVKVKRQPDKSTHNRERERPMVVVHCSAGIGRTGCFLAILNGIQQLRSNANVDVLAILCSLRLHRGGMVQTAEQYELIHRVLKLYAETM